MARWVSAAVLLLCLGCGKATRDPAPGGAGASGGSASGGSASGGGAAGECSSYLFVDADGDGFGRVPYVEQLESCVTTAPAGYALSGTDCDDDDASIWRSAAPDRDADGAYDLDAIECVGGDPLPLSYGSGNHWKPDCDDYDDSVQRVYYRDADGDGIGTDELDAEACGGSEPPSGYVEAAGDCDDTDALRNYLAADQWADDVDSNCDGIDDPFVCEADPGIFECPCAARPRPTDALPTSCRGAADLLLLPFEVCALCGPEVVFVDVANTGDRASSELRIEVELADSSDGRAAAIPPPPVVLPPLAPGEVRSGIVLPQVWPIVAVRVTSEADCDPTNDVLALENAYFECFP